MSTMLVDKTPVGLWVSSDQADLVLTFKEGSFWLKTYGDCCSQSWWADVIGVKQLINSRITGIEEVGLPMPEDDRSRQEVDVARESIEGGEAFIKSASEVGGDNDTT